MLNIGFTGHRDKRATQRQLEIMANRYNDPFKFTWHYGAAIEGFDSQVYWMAHKYGIKLIDYPPEWDVYPGKSAAIIRNYQIVDAVDELVAFYDGRTSGGTYKTVEYAISKRKRIYIITPE